MSSHDAASLKPYAPDAEEPASLMNPLSIMRSLNRRLSSDARSRRASADLDEVARQARVMSQRPRGIYEHFRRGLLEYHSEASGTPNALTPERARVRPHPAGARWTPLIPATSSRAARRTASPS